MTRDEIHADKNISITEKQLFLWMNNSYEKNEIFEKSLPNIAKLSAMSAKTVFSKMKSLHEKGYILKISKGNSKGRKGRQSNNYKILK